MYSYDFIKKELNCDDSEYLEKYYKIYKFYKENPTKIKYSQYHHCIPVFITRINKNLKNRNYAEDLHDNLYKVEDNIVLLPGKFHLLAHYYLGMAMKTKEAINSFQIFLDDYVTSIDKYDIDKVKELGQLYQETCLPNSYERYYTRKEKEEKFKNLKKTKV